MTDPDLRRQWPGWLIAAVIAVIILVGAIASCLQADGT